ncbi:GNAT family N-acetyltransferase [Clostridium diolis]|uniref:N-acetyltransferase n=1 Tax=Clostridium diolis TaxID=223919 RepID=A0AAV3VXB4_9CLOT|nr:GNAT family N-acetyltransferase [Clostridium diolis]GEA30565.1 N-acetyltransferase [Clostridium diolis]
MNKNPYEQFPHISDDEITLRKIFDIDLDEIFEIYRNEELFKYSPVMIKKNKNTVVNMIGHFERDFHKKKCIFLGICLNNEPEKVVGIAEIFDYSNEVNMITIGYRLNNKFWGNGIATKAVRVMVDYLFNDIGINRIQAFVMPENIKSQNVLKKMVLLKRGQLGRDILGRDKMLLI